LKKKVTVNAYDLGIIVQQFHQQKQKWENTATVVSVEAITAVSNLHPAPSLSSF